MRPAFRRQGLLPDWRIAVPVLIVVAALLAAPLVFGTFGLFIMMRMMLLVLFALGFNLLLGYTGLLSFGQAGFFAVGAYVCALILLEAPSLLLGIAGGVVAAALVALVLGYLSVRLTEIYFAMLTLSFGMMIWSLVWRSRDVTGGDDGLTGIPRAPLELPGLSIDLSEIPAYYYFVLAMTLIAVWLMYRIVNSPLGLTFQAVRDSAVRAAFVGIAAVGAMASPWLLVFSMFLFGSLSLAKRYTAFTQAYLGLAMAVAPVGGWIAAELLLPHLETEDRGPATGPAASVRSTSRPPTWSSTRRWNSVATRRSWSSLTRTSTPRSCRPSPGPSAATPGALESRWSTPTSPQLGQRTG